MEIHLTENKTCTDAIEIDSGISHFSRLTTCKSHVLDSSLSMRGRPDRSSRPDVLFWGLTPVSGMQHSSVTLPQRMGCHSQSMDDIRLCISPPWGQKSFAKILHERWYSYLWKMWQVRILYFALIWPLTSLNILGGQWPQVILPPLNPPHCLIIFQIGCSLVH